MSDHLGELLSSYIDEEMTEIEKEWVERHLETCGACKDEYVQMMMMKHQFQEVYQMIELPEGIEDKVFAKINSNLAPRSFGFLNGTAFLIMVALAVVLSLISGPIVTVGVYIVQTIFSIGRGLMYAVPSLLSAIPYMAAAVSGFIVIIIIMSIFTLRFLVHSVGKTAGVEDI